ncbi:hypothetical protein ACOMHN_001283 [Nucella lapillus]
MADDGDHEDSSLMVLSPCAGSSLIDGQLVYSPCSRYFMCCCGRAVKVYNTTNGQCSQVLEGHREAATGLAINPANKLQLFSCGLDGDIHQWSYTDGVLLRTYSFYMPLHALVSVYPSATYVSAVARRPQAANCSLLRLPLRKEVESSSATKEGATEAAVKTTIILPECDADPKKVSYGCKEQYIAAVRTSELAVYSCKEKIFRKHKAKEGNHFTCVACHPTECCLATGHINGKITLWKNFFHKDKTVRTEYHWHSLPVLCLAFSPEGSVLLSGGHECVVMRWQLNAEEKTPLPRLCGPLHSITPSPDGSVCVVAHTSNVLTVITSSSGITNVMCGLSRCQMGLKTARPMPVGLLFDPQSKALVTNGRPGQLQFYCRETDRQLYSLDIVGQNYISPNSLDKPAMMTEVEHAAFDPSGHWLATFQRWDDGVMTPEYCLKFWAYSKKQRNYQLNTTVETPHYGNVRCLQFSPDQSSRSPTMVSTGDDGYFKLWTLTTELKQGKKIQQWTCVFLGHNRQQGANQARFSPDGKKLAVVLGMSVTLWDPHTNTLLDRAPFHTQIRCIEFGGGESSHLLVVTTLSHLTVLDINTLSVVMQMEIPQALLAIDGDLVCAVSQDQVCTFRLGADPPVVQTTDCPTPPLATAFLPHPSGVSQLYVLDCHQTLWSLGPKADPKPSLRSQIQLTQTLPQTPFQALLSSAHHKENTTNTAASTSGHSAPQLKPTPLAGFDVMNVRIITGDAFSSKAQWMLETMLIKRKGQTDPMEVEEEREEEVAMGMECS